jgi:hypothetical protein
MKTLFSQLSWNRVLRNLRRHRPGSPIRRRRHRNETVLELIRLDDRIAPGSVWATAASQAVFLTGAAGWLDLGETDIAAVGPMANSAIPAAHNRQPVDDDADADLSLGRSAHFSLTSNDAQPIFTTDDPPTTGLARTTLGSPVSLTDLGAPDTLPPIFVGTSPPAATDMPVQHAGGGGSGGPAAPQSGSGAGSQVAARASVIPPPPATDSAGPARPPAANPPRAAQPTAPVAHVQPLASVPSQPAATMPTPTGHFAQQLQAIFHAGDSPTASGTSETASPQLGVGSLIGGKLASLTGFDFGASSSHRTASLLGEAMNAGSDTPIGLRTSTFSSGLFGLVGSQSIGDMMSHGGPGGGPAGAAGSIGAAIPTAGVMPGPWLRVGRAGPLADGTTSTGDDGSSGSSMTPMLLPGEGGSSDDNDPPLPDGVTAPDPIDPSSLPDPGDPDPPDDGSGDGGTLGTSGGVFGPGGGMMGMDGASGPQDQANFTLTVQGTDPNSGQPYTLYETGTVAFPPQWDVSSPDYPLNVDYTFDLHYGGGDLDPNNDSTGEVQWSGDATETGILAGYDIDQVNQDQFGLDHTQADSYVLDCTGNDSFTAPETSAPVEYIGTDTKTHQINSADDGTDNFILHVEGPGSQRAVTCDDSVNSSFSDSDTGTDSDPATSSHPNYLTDSFTDTDAGTYNETDHVEGTIGADGTFQLTSFQFNSTDNYTYTDSVNGREGGPEPGGSQGDAFTEADRGNSSEPLVASGTADSWTANLDDSSRASFGDGDNGGENSSTTNNGTTDTNGDTYQTGDGGSESDALHVGGDGSGTGDTATFNVSSVSDRIEDNYTYQDSGDGTAGETKTGETDSDHYHQTDNGDADEVLTVNGGATDLGAGYTDTAHDGFTDSDDANDSWSGSAGGGGFTYGTGGPGATDNGTDHGTDGDGGSETIHLAANAALPDWQTTDSNGNPPTWQINGVTADVTGTANVHSGDDGHDTQALAQDSGVEHYVDTSTGTDQFGLHLTGNGTTGTLGQNATFNLTTHSEDDNTGNWTDPRTLQGEPATDQGHDESDDIENTTSTVSVNAQRPITADGVQSPMSTVVDVNAGGTADLTDDGTDDDAASGLDVQSTVDDTANMGQGVHIHAVGAGNTTTVGIDRNLGGFVGLAGTETDTSNGNPADLDTDTAGGNLTGTVGGHLHQGGTVTGSTITPTATTGDFGINVNGHTGDTNVEHITTTPATFAGDDPFRGYFTGGGEYVTPFAPPSNGSVPVPDPAVPLGLPGLPFPDRSSDVWVTRKVTVPSLHLAEDDTDAGGAWSQGDVDFNSDVVQSAKVEGQYTNSLYSLWPAATGHGVRTDSTEVQIAELTDPLTGLLDGSRTTIHKLDLHVTGPSVTTGADVTGGTTQDDATLTDTDTITGTEGLAGPMTADLTETHTVTGSGYFKFNFDWSHTLPNSFVASGSQRFDITSSRDYHDGGGYTGGSTGGAVPTTAGGVDKVKINSFIDTTAPVHVVSIHFLMANKVVYRAPGSPAVPPNPDHPWDQGWPAVPAGQIGEDEGPVSKWWETADGQPTNSDTYRWPQFDGRDWFAKASDFAAGMGDAVSCGLTARVRTALGYNDAVDTTGGAYLGGQITGTALSIAAAGANPCNAGKAMGVVIRRLSAVQAAGQVANAAEAAKNGDPVGFTLNVIGAKMSMSKMGENCFAAGTPIGLEYGRTAVEQVREGDRVLTVNEHDPDGPLTPRTVARTYQHVAPIWELYAGGRVVRTTAEHPFYVRGKGWTPVSEIQPDDELRTGERGWVRCAGVENTRRTEAVYNFEVEGDHTYFVGDPVTWGFSLWAHNYNQWGRRGSPQHQARIQAAETRLRADGWTPKSGGSLAERAVDVGGGRVRFPDLVMERGAQQVAIQAGRVNAAGQAVTREVQALADLRGTGIYDHVFFLKY